MRKRFVWLCAILFLLMALALPAAPTEAREQRDDLRAALSDPGSGWARAFQSENALEDLAAFADAPRYRLTLQYETGMRTVSGHEKILFTNRGTRALTTLYLRTYARIWGDGDEKNRFALSNLTVDGRPAEFTMGETLIAVPMDRALLPGRSVLLALDFRAQLPILTQRLGTQLDFSVNPGTYGVTPSGLYGLSEAIPLLLPVGDQGHEYDRMPEGGVALNGETSLFDVEITLPLAWKVIGSGHVTRQTEANGKQTVHLMAETYGFHLFISPSVEAVTRQAGDVSVTVYLPGGMAQTVLSEAETALETYRELLGPYPWRDLQILPIQFGNGVGGMNPGAGLILMHPAFFAANTQLVPPSVTDPELKAYMTADTADQRRHVLFHEIAHTWWGHLVTQDMVYSPFWQEGLTDATAVAGVEAAYGPAAAERIRRTTILQYKANRAAGTADVAVGLPVPPGTEDYRAYVQMSYIKPALYFDQVRQKLGNEVYFAAMRGYIEQNRMTITRGRGPIEKLMSEEGVAALYDHMLVETHGDEEIGLLTPEQMRQLGIKK